MASHFPFMELEGVDTVFPPNTPVFVCRIFGLIMANQALLSVTALDLLQSVIHHTCGGDDSSTELMSAGRSSVSPSEDEDRGYGDSGSMTIERTTSSTLPTFVDPPGTRASLGASKLSAGSPTRYEIKIIKYHFTMLYFMTVEAIMGKEKSMCSNTVPSLGTSIDLDELTPAFPTIVRKYTDISRSWHVLCRKLRDCVFQATTPPDGTTTSPNDTRAYALVHQRLWTDMHTCLQRMTIHPRDQLNIIGIPNTERDLRLLLAITFQHCLNYTLLTVLAQRSARIADHLIVEMALLDIWPQHVFFPWSSQLRRVAVTAVISMLHSAASNLNIYNMTPIVAQWRAAFWSKLIPYLNAPLTTRNDNSANAHIPDMIRFGQLAAFHGASMMLLGLLSLKITVPSFETAEFETEKEAVPFALSQEDMSAEQGRGSFQISIVRQIMRKALQFFTPVAETSSGRRVQAKATQPTFPALSMACLAQCLGILQLVFAPRPRVPSLVGHVPDTRFKDDLVTILSTLALQIRIAAMNDKSETGHSPKLLRHLIPDIVNCMRLIIMQTPDFIPWRASVLRALRDSLKLTHSSLWQALEKTHCTQCLRSNIAAGADVVCCCDENFGRERQSIRWQRDVRNAVLRCTQSLASHGIQESEERDLLTEIVDCMIEIVDWVTPSMLESLAWICKHNPWLIGYLHECAIHRFWNSLSLPNDSHRTLMSAVYLADPVRENDEINILSTCSPFMSDQEDSSTSSASFKEQQVPHHETDDTNLPIGNDYLLFISISCLGLLARLRSTDEDDSAQALVYCALENLMRTHRHPWVRCQSALTLLASHSVPEREDLRHWHKLSTLCLNVLQSIFTDQSSFVKSTFVKRFENSPYCDFCDSRSVDLLVYTVAHAQDSTSQFMGIKLLTTLISRFPLTTKSIHLPRSAVEDQLVNAIEKILVVFHESLAIRFMSVQNATASMVQLAKADASLIKALKFFAYLAARIPKISLSCSYWVLGKISILFTMEYVYMRELAVSWQDDFLRAHEKLIENSKSRFLMWVQKLNVWIPSMERGFINEGCSLHQCAQLFSLDLNYHYGVELSSSLRDICLEMRGCIPFTYISARSAVGSVASVSLLETVSTQRGLNKGAPLSPPSNHLAHIGQLALKALRILMIRGTWVSDDQSLDESNRNILRREFFQGYLADHVANFCLLLGYITKIQNIGVTESFATMGVILQLMKSIRLFLKLIPDWRYLNPPETFRLIQRGLLTALKKSLAHHPSHPGVHNGGSSPAISRQTVEKDSETASPPQSVKSQGSTAGESLEDFSTTVMLLPQPEGETGSDSDSSESSVPKGSDENKLLRHVWCEMLLTIGTFGFLSAHGATDKRFLFRSPFTGLPPPPTHHTHTRLHSPGPRPRPSPTRSRGTLANFKAPFRSTTPADFEKLASYLLQSERDVWECASYTSDEPTKSRKLSCSSFSSVELEGIDKLISPQKDVFMYRVLYHLTRCIWFGEKAGTLNKTWAWRLQEVAGNILDNALHRIDQLRIDNDSGCEEKILQALAPLKKWSFWSNTILLMAPRLLTYGDPSHASHETHSLAIRVCQCVSALDQATGREHYYETARLVHTTTQARDGDVFKASILQLFILLRDILDKAVTVTTDLQIQLRGKMPSSTVLSRDLVGGLRPHLMVFQSFLPFYPFFGAGVIAKVANALMATVRSCVETYTTLQGYRHTDFASNDQSGPSLDSIGRVPRVWSHQVRAVSEDVNAETQHQDSGFNRDDSSRRSNARTSAHPSEQQQPIKGSPKHGVSVVQLCLIWLSDSLLTISRLGSVLSPWSHLIMDPLIHALSCDIPIPVKIQVVEALRVMLASGCLSSDCVQVVLSSLTNTMYRTLGRLLQTGSGDTWRYTSSESISRVATAFDSSGLVRGKSKAEVEQRTQSDVVMVFCITELVTLIKATFPSVCDNLLQNDIFDLLQELIGSPFYASLQVRIFKEVHLENRSQVPLLAASPVNVSSNPILTRTNRSNSRPSFDGREGSLANSESADQTFKVTSGETMSKRRLARLSWTLSAPVNSEKKSEKTAKLKPLATVTGNALMELITGDSPQEPWKVIRRNSEADVRLHDYVPYANERRDSADEMAGFEDLFEVPQPDFKYQDWAVWATNWMLAHLRYSPSPSIRACVVLEQWFQNPDDDKKVERRGGKDANSLSVSRARMILKVPGAGSLPIPNLLVELFPVAYLSVWQRLPRKWKEKAIEVITAVLTIPETPRSVVTLCVSLIEYLLHFDSCADFDFIHLATLCHRFSLLHQALFFWEAEWSVIGEAAFRPKREAVLSALLSLNSACNQIDGVLGVFQLVTSLLVETSQPAGPISIKVRKVPKHQLNSAEAAWAPDTQALPGITGSINEQRQWYEQMHCWSKAVELYHLSQSHSQANGLEKQLEEACGLLRCLCEMNDWKSMQRILNNDLDLLIAQCINLHGVGRPALGERRASRVSNRWLPDRPLPKISTAFPLTQESLSNHHTLPEGELGDFGGDRDDDSNHRHGGYMDDSRFRSNTRELIRLSCLSALHLQDWSYFQHMAGQFIAINQSLQQQSTQSLTRPRRRSTRSSGGRHDSLSNDNMTSNFSDNDQSENDLNLILYGPFGVLVSEHKFFATILAILSGHAAKARVLLTGLIEAFAKKFAFVAVTLKENESINTLALLRAQQFTELAEIIDCLESQKAIPSSTSGDSTFLTPRVLKLWNNRDEYADWKSPDIALAILTTRSIALPSVLRPMQWLTLADLCENDNKVAFARLIEEGLINERRPPGLAWLKYISTVFSTGALTTHDAYSSLTRVEAVRFFKSSSNSKARGKTPNVCTIEQIQALRASFDWLMAFNTKEQEVGRGFRPEFIEPFYHSISPQVLVSRVTAGRSEILEYSSLFDVDPSLLLDTSSMDNMIFNEEFGTKDACHAFCLRQLVTFMRKSCFSNGLFDDNAGFDLYKPKLPHNRQEQDAFAVYEAVCNPNSHTLFVMFGILCFTLTRLDPYDVDAWQALAQLNFDVVKEAPRHWIREAVQEAQQNGLTPSTEPGSSRNPLLPTVDCVWCNLSSVRGIMNGEHQSLNVAELQREVSAKKTSGPCLKLTPKFVLHCTQEAIKGYLQCIRLCADASHLGVFANLLRVLNLWFEAWEHEPLNQLIKDNLADIPSTVWIEVVPQLLSRMSRKKRQLMPTLQAIFSRLVDEAPQALIFPLGVSAESPLDEYSEPAKKTLIEFGIAHPQLVEESLQFIRGMKNTAVKPHEKWYSMLDEAAKKFFDEQHDHNHASAVKLLESAFRSLEEGLKSPSLSPFLADFREQITRARWTLAEWHATQDTALLHIMWGLFHDIYTSIWKARSKQTSFSLWVVAPDIAAKVNWNLAVPGEYTPTQPMCPYIFAFFSLVKVLPSKQKPRYMEVLGSDGNIYAFLLKGHEDLRQDQRAIQVLHFLDQLMQLQSANGGGLPARYVSPFADVTASLVTLPGAAIATGASMPRFQHEHSASIMYPIVVPLSDSVGLIQWLSGADTLHSLVKVYRTSLNPPRSVANEIQLIREACPDYEALGMMQQYEIFKDMQARTSQEDLRVMLLWQARHSPAAVMSGLTTWFKRRLEFSKSLAGMSVFGYMLGLGDRHPSNILIDRATGTVIHIDFGDCFELANLRHRFPERFPFRLTRMLVEALGPTGYEGVFRMACIRTMEMIRSNRELVLSILDTFLFDPLASWNSLLPFLPCILAELGRPPEAIDQVEQSWSARGETEKLNECATAILARADQKLRGLEFGTDPLPTEVQVDTLIKEATDDQNLCQAYLGWCPFW
eukprot:Blabericola_migrator_1__9825@NODE_53_length_16193_cov_63_357497_g49_i0_p1_GENE_NODE_53_length_16193_cov_63_357497_g49_i0NODE_53_length_16193_cov_63_357497_g49_i0_p1_ORF_typecomplete_len4043_score861_20PI3_PI4_kinase/PF00454_27/1e53FATC/PF02260_20/4_6e14FAT/PF02259_23/3_6e03FAT/PF02259_23/5_6e08FAT/PF02259_23/0_029FAT/PF02259_23/7e03FRB_dom/PF08771_11/1_2e03FRB_dom/PF08771_11/4e09APH/PF01636_23/0_54_NODE_53_length_16193_cov_63_357497_g49_i075112129